MEKSKNFITGVIFIIAGIIAIAFAIVVISQATSYYVGSYTWYETYGGDAYTGIQNAAADTANNVYYLNNNLEDFAQMFKVSTFGFMLVVACVCFGVGAQCLANKPAVEYVTAPKDSDNELAKKYLSSTYKNDTNNVNPININYVPKDSDNELVKKYLSSTYKSIMNSYSKKNSEDDKI